MSDRTTRQAAPDPPAPDSVLPPAVARRVTIARAALMWERLWRAAWPLPVLGGGFAAAAGFGLFQGLHPWLHIPLLGLLALLAAAALWRLRGLRLPPWAEGLRRLERDGGATHRPLAGLGDRPAVGADDPAVAALWAAHRDRLAAAAARLRPAWPRPAVAAGDRFALRGLVAILLFVSIVIGGPDFAPRLRAAFVPEALPGAAIARAAVDLYVTPPDYTRQPPLYLAAGGAAAEGAAVPAALAIPAGSRVAVRLSGTSAESAVLMLGAAAHPLDADGAAEGEMSSGARIAVEAGGSVLAEWPVEILADDPPRIAFARPPAATERHALRLDWQAADDWGIETLSAALRLGPDAPSGLDPTPQVIALPAPQPALPTARGTRFEDLTPHEWAGQRVTIVLTATDALGQIGRSEPAEIVLPERPFSHPVARAIIAIRAAVTERPGTARQAAAAIDDLAVRPGAYGEDRTAFLALRVAARRLQRGPEAMPAELAGIRDLLWETALRIEDGGVSLAEQAMRAAASDLQAALEREAAEAEIAALTEALRRAMDAYLQELQRAMAEGRLPPPMPPNGQSQPLDPGALDRMLDRIDELAGAGRREEAQDLLAQLQGMMESLSTAAPSAEQMRAQQEASALQRDLQRLLQDERALRDRTFRGSGQAGQDPEIAPEGMEGAAPPSAAEQEEIRHRLGELMRRMGELTGEIPEGFGRAEQAMRQAEDALRSPWPEDAVEPQGEAIQALGQGMQGLGEAMMQQGAMGVAPGAAGTPRRPGPGPDGVDPLGRPSGQGGGVGAEDVGVPAEPDIQRSREIVEELRRRLDERDRPAIERDYIERLLRRF